MRIRPLAVSGPAWLVPAAGAAACVLAALALGLWAALPNLHWFAGLRRPSFRPPTLVFGLAWAAFHGLALWALTRVLRSPDWMPDRTAAMEAYFVQLSLNALWPVAVFGLHRPRLGLLVAVALLVAILVATRLFARVDRIAGRLLLVYLLWIAFVVLLNLSVAIRN